MVLLELIRQRDFETQKINSHLCGNKNTDGKLFQTTSSLIGGSSNPQPQSRQM